MKFRIAVSSKSVVSRYSTTVGIEFEMHTVVAVFQILNSIGIQAALLYMACKASKKSSKAIPTTGCGGL
jgi:hypothetical protein